MRQRGFTLVQILVVAATLAVGTDVVIAQVSTQLDARRIEQAKQGLVRIDAALTAYRNTHHELPTALSDLGTDPTELLDPWGRPYEYVNFELKGTCGQRTFDSLPINSDYDLYSRGSDGRTGTNLRSEESRDDVVRARDGAYMGLASDF